MEQSIGDTVNVEFGEPNRISSARHAMENPLDIAVEHILAFPAIWPLRVGIDGRSAAGKTTFADGLSARLRGAGRNVLRAGIDDFHPPGHGPRSAAGCYTVESYYAEGYDYTAFRDCLLAPLDPKGDRRCRLRLHDSYSDTPIDCPAVEVPKGAIVIIDGCFLLRPELRGFWEFVMWLDVSFETMIERAVKRDIAWMPSEDAVRARYRDRWIPLHGLYEQTGARSYADMIIDNEAPRSPTLHHHDWPNQEDKIVRRVRILFSQPPPACA